MSLTVFLLLLLLGVGVGTLGTLLGAGGGFILVPTLLFLYPEESPQVIAGMGLAVVLLNAISGTAGYLRQGRVDLRTGLLFASGTLPGGLVGLGLNYLLGRSGFEGAFAVFLLAVGGWLLLGGRAPDRSPSTGRFSRSLVDAQGNRYEWAFSPWSGWALSFVVGLSATLFGVGGGTLHVAGMVGLLGMPPHVATATSQFVLMLTAATGTAVHLAAGTLFAGGLRVVALGGGVVVGAQIGAALAHRVPGRLLVRVLGTVMVVVGLRLIWNVL